MKRRPGLGRPVRLETARPDPREATRIVRRVCRTLLFALVGTFLGTTADSQQPDKYRDARLNMVERELVREGIKNQAVLESMRQVPRHLFVSQEQRGSAYYDLALPIGNKQTISPPFIVAYMTEVLDPQPTDRVLEIGTGSGFQAAVLSGIVKDVYTIEIVEPLGIKAAKLLRELGYDNVHCLVGDGYKGWPQHAPFDKIIVTCSPESVPQPLIDQLKEGGRMIVPLGERYSQVFYLFEKRDGELKKSKLLPALFVPMTGVSEENRKVQPDPAHPELRNGNFETDSDEDGRPDGWHYQRQLTLARDEAPEGDAYVKFENAEQSRGAQMLQGMAIDGSKVGSLRINLQVKADNIRQGPNSYEKAALIVHFYDPLRRPLEEQSLVPWTGTFNWKRVSANVHVPPRAREAVVRIGLNGATGTLCVDDVVFKPVPR